MKKFLCVLLCLAMLTCITPLMSFAVEGETTPSGTAINNQNGLAAIDGGGDFYLTEDIYVDLSTATFPLIKDTFSGTLDGRGHSVLFVKKNADGTLTTENNKTNSVTLTASGGVVFKSYKVLKLSNITFGSAEAPILLTASTANAGVFGNEINRTASDIPVKGAPTLENVTVYCELNANRNGSMNQGIYWAQTMLHNITLTNCKAIGKINVSKHVTTAYMQLGGFIGNYRPSSALTMRFINCVSDVEFNVTTQEGTVSNGNSYGGFVGYLDCSAKANSVVFENCMAMHTPDLKNSKGESAHNGAFCGQVAYDGDPVTEGTAAKRVTTTNCLTLDNLVNDLSFATANDASVRFNAPTGIRFYNTISAKAFDTLVNAFGEDNVTMGTIIAPAILVQNAGAFTKEALDNLNSQSPTYLDVAFGGEWFETENDTNTYVGSIVNILEDNYDLGYCGIGYITFNDGTGTKTVYANYGEQGIPAFTVRSLAEAVMADPNASEAEKAVVAKYLGTSEQ